MRSLGLASLVTLICLPSPAYADETLTLNLPASRTLAAQSSSPPKAASSSSERARDGASPNRRGGLRQGPKEKVVGRLGITTQDARIRASRSSQARTLARARAGIYLALTREQGDWYGILMEDGSVGWIPRRDVRVLNYEVVAPDAPSRPRYSDYTPDLNDPLLTSGQQTLLNAAYRYLGVPYKYGGVSPDGGIDCSAFVQRCFGEMGVHLPRTAAEQYHCGMSVSVQDLQAADRLYFASRDGRINHTGIYIGNGYFIHASSSRHGVAVSRLSEPLYSRRFAGARR